MSAFGFDTITAASISVIAIVVFAIVVVWLDLDDFDDPR